jgi:hypothetical protein
MKSVIVGLVCLAGCVLSSWAADSQGFPLRDFLGRTWRNEYVQFPLSKAQQKAAIQGRELVGPDGKAVAYQIVPGATRKQPAQIAFLADLDPFEAREYRFTDAEAKTPTDLTIEETGEVIRIANKLTGISIRKKLADGAGPIDGIRLPAGAWVGGSRLVSTQQVASYAATIVARGPVFSEVRCRVDFGMSRKWELTIRVQANEPVVLLDESYALGDESAFVLNLSRGFSPDRVLYRDGVRLGSTAVWSLAEDGGKPVFVLEPWLHWNYFDRQGQWFALYNESGADLLALGAREAGVWVEPDNPASRAQSYIPVRKAGADIGATFPLGNGKRRWMIAAMNKDASLSALAQKEGKGRVPAVQNVVIKHAHFPLNLIKDYILVPPKNEEHPRLLITKKQAGQFRKTFKADPARLASLTTTPVGMYDLDDWITYYLGTGDPALGKHLVETAVRTLQHAVDTFFDQDYPPVFGLGNSNDDIFQGTFLADAILDSDQLSPELRQRLRAQIAWLAYTVNRDDYWSPERGFCANPNMTTKCAGFRTTLGCMVAAHPLARTWVANGMKELKDNELDTWSDENGGWLEAPHYAMVSFDYLVGCFLMARNSGFNDFVFDPKMKKIAEWFAKISTPPDSRIKGWRHLPPIGNTYISEPTGQFGVLAGIWKDKDPAFAAQMQWMHRQQGSFPWPGIGGFFPSLAGYRTMLFDPAIAETAPAYKSELFPQTCVILRNGFPTDRETQLLLLTERTAHYDYDTGSITFWGKGRIVADDFGYYGRASIEDHSLLETPLAGNAAPMHVKEFAPSDAFDYVRAVKDGWTRQIAFVKSADPLGPNYTVLGDTLREAAPSTWRLWLTASNVTLGPQTARVEGKEDVDTDVVFLLPANVALKTESKSRTSGSGLRPDGSQNNVETTQTGLIASLQNERAITAVLYPRLKTQKPPVITTLAGGKAVKVETEAGTDYVFLSAEPFTFKEGEIGFEGTAGSVQLRLDQMVLSLGAAGSISVHAVTLTADKPATRKVNQ